MLNHFSLLACNSSLLANFFFKSSISEKCHWEARKQQYSRLHCLCIKWITDAEGPLMGKGWKKWCDCSLIIKQICYLWSALWTEGFLGGSDSKVCLQCGRPRFDPCVRKIPWRREWQPTPVFSPGKSHGHRSLAGYIPWDLKESDMTERLHFLFFSICGLRSWQFNLYFMQLLIY